MLIWRLDRLFGFGVVCAMGTAVVPVIMAVVVARMSDTDNILGGLVTAAAIMLLGTLIGSPVTTAVGIALFGALAAVADVGIVGLAVIGSGLFATLVLHDLSASFRRAPTIHRNMWTPLPLAVLAVGLVAGGLSGTAYFVATRVLWQAIAIPIGLLAIGLGARLAAETHAARVRGERSRWGSSRGNDA